MGKDSYVSPPIEFAREGNLDKTFCRHSFQTLIIRELDYLGVRRRKANRLTRMKLNDQLSNNQITIYRFHS